MPESEERLAPQIHVSETFGDVVFVLGWHLAFGSVNGQWQAATRIVVAKNYIRNGISAFLTIPPCLNDGPQVTFGPRECEWSRVKQDHGCLGIGRINRFDQFLLPARQTQTGTISPFALDSLSRTHE